MSKQEERVQTEEYGNNISFFFQEGGEWRAGDRDRGNRQRR